MSNNRRKRTIGGLALLRLVSVISVLTVTSGGVAYAALQSQEAKLTSNTIQTATAGLQVSINGTTFANSTPGYGFGSIVPGGPAGPTDGSNLYLRNTGQTALALKMYITSTPLNPQNVDLSKVYVVFTPVGAGSIQKIALLSLMQSAANGGLSILSPVSLAAGATQQYKMQIAMDADAVTAPLASITDIDFGFTGTAVTQ